LDRTDSILNSSIPTFLVEIRKKNGAVFKSESIRHIFHGINRYLTEINSEFDLFKSGDFEDCRKIVDGYLKKLQSEEDPTIKQAKEVTEEQERELWQRGILGSSDPQSLQDALMFQCGKFFALRGGPELRGFRSFNLKFETDGAMTKITYTENRSKTNQGGLKNRSNRKTVPHIENAAELNSFTSLYDKYMMHLPKNADLSKSFWFTPNKNFNPEDNRRPWYSATPRGENYLGHGWY